MWQEPVADRTERDVIQKNEKAYRDIATLSRIEINTQYLASLMGLSIPAKMWGIFDFPTNPEMQRILDNIQAARNEVYEYVGPTWDELDDRDHSWGGLDALDYTWDRATGIYLIPNIPNTPALPFNTWQSLNDAEQIQLNIYQALEANNG